MPPQLSQGWRLRYYTNSSRATGLWAESPESVCHSLSNVASTYRDSAVSTHMVPAIIFMRAALGALASLLTMSGTEPPTMYTVWRTIEGCATTLLYSKHSAYTQQLKVRASQRTQQSAVHRITPQARTYRLESGVGDIDAKGGDAQRHDVGHGLQRSQVHLGTTSIGKKLNQG